MQTKMKHRDSSRAGSHKGAEQEQHKFSNV